MLPDLTDDDLRVCRRAAGTDQIRRVLGIGHAALTSLDGHSRQCIAGRDQALAFTRWKHKASCSHRLLEQVLRRHRLDSRARPLKEQVEVFRRPTRLRSRPKLHRRHRAPRPHPLLHDPRPKDGSQAYTQPAAHMPKRTGPAVKVPPKVPPSIPGNNCRWCRSPRHSKRSPGSSFHRS